MILSSLFPPRDEFFWPDQQRARTWVPPERTIIEKKCVCEPICPKLLYDLATPICIMALTLIIIIIFIYENFGWKNGSNKTETSQEHDKVLKEITIDEDEQEDLNVDINPKNKLLTINDLV